MQFLKIQPMRNKSIKIIKGATLAFCLLTTPAHALLITANPGETFQDAQALDGRFDLSFSADIGDYRIDPDTGQPYSVNTSTSIPHVTVDASQVGHGLEHWYSFRVAKTSTVILDVDYGADAGQASGWFSEDGEYHSYPEMDTFMGLYDFNGNTVAQNDDHDRGIWGPIAGAGGSSHHYDSFIQTVVDSGRYYVSINHFRDLEFRPDFGYILQVSVSHPVPEPSMVALLMITLGGLAAKRLKRVSFR